MHPSANLEGILAQAGAAALIVDDSGIVLFATDQACRTFKYAPGKLNGLSVECLMPERFRLAHIGHRLRFTDELRTRPMGTGLELFALCKDGSELRVNLSLKRVQSGLKILIVVKIEVRELDFGTSSAN
jgi:protein-histidine pros-kinase